MLICSVFVCLAGYAAHYKRNNLNKCFECFVYGLASIVSQFFMVVCDGEIPKNV